MFKINLPPDEMALTKRNFLSKIAAVFDPLGFLSPFIIRAKILIQEMWTTGCDWDEIVDETLTEKAQLWFGELAGLVHLRIPRCLKKRLEVELVQLHIFVDSSEVAYGSAVYTRHVYTTGEVTCQLVMSKSRVAPLKATSIPRLELMAAVLGVRLAESVAKVMNIDIHEGIFWSDSMDVLWWVRGRSRQFKPFVANRVGQIQTVTEPAQWRHVPTDQNPADVITRGLSSMDLIQAEKWWNGPAYLQLPEGEWPLNKVEAHIQENQEMKKHHHKTAIDNTLITTDIGQFGIEPTKFSSWQKLNRVYAYVSRFIDNCRLPKQLRHTGELQPNEIQEAETYFVRLAQKEKFSDEVNKLSAGKVLKVSKLVPLKPGMDEEGVIRSNGRLEKAECLPWKTRHPIILPRRHWVTKLIVKHYHEQGQHAGTNQILSALSVHYWIVSAREEIREWEKECAKCKRTKAAAASQIMAPLPVHRTSQSMRAFTECSVDYGGPFPTIQGRGKTRTKRYLCLFTCFATRAVHLEIAYSLDTDSFLNAFYRMASRRGRPSHLWCDNATNFVGGSNELRGLVNSLDRDKIQRSTAGQGVTWHFQPPLAPHFSGVHEVMIKAAKRAIYAILGPADVTDEELLSAIVGAEGLVNSRPLTYQSANAADILPLTPNHFLFGQMGGQFAPDSVDTTQFNPRRRWRHVQELVRQFWHRWLREWLPSLSVRKKWHHSKENIEVGDVVLVLSPDLPRGKWPLGQIVNVFPGDDGKVRVVDVKLSSGVMRRPIAKICPLEKCNASD